MQLTVQMKQAGKRRNQVAETKIELEKRPETVKELLEFTVKACVQDFRNKQKEGVMVLDETQIEDKASAGKVGFGFFYGETKVDEVAAIETAIQAFEDGIVVIFLDGVKKEVLLEEIEITEATVVTFVKLVMLAGRMW